MNENLIERYLLNLLSEEEKQSFEKRLKTDKTLAQEVFLQKEIIEDIEGIGRLELKSQLKNIHTELYPKKSETKGGSRIFILRVAAAAIFIGVLVGAWWMMQQGPSNQELFTENFEPYALSLNQRSDTDEVFYQIENHYFNKNYEQVIPLLEGVLDQSEQKSSQLQLGLGISYMQSGKSQEAINQFKTIISKNDFNFEDEARWYLALAYLKTNNITNAREALSVLASESDRDHHEEAKKILSSLK